MRPGPLALVANENKSVSTRDEGTQQLFRSEPRSSPVQSFRFRIGTQPEDPAQWKRFGAECNLPLRAVVLEASPSESVRGFFEVSDPRVQLLAFKPAEFRAGWYALRFQENGGRGAQAVRLTTPFRIIKAVRANTVEDPTREKVDLGNFSLGPWENLTVLAKIQ